VDIRPRTTGEIFDDAWRLYRADAPLLLGVSSLFVLPAVVTLVLLLVLPKPDVLAARFLLPALAALLIPVSALGSSSCQELFRRRADGRPLGTGVCWHGCQRSLDHMAARAFVWSLTLLGSAFVALPGCVVGGAILSGMGTEGSARLPLIYCSVLLVGFVVSGLAALAGGQAIQSILAGGERHCFGAWVESLRQTQRQAGKAAAIALSRPILWAIVVLNLHLLVRIGLWIGDDLAGFDLAVASLALSSENYVYVMVLILLAGMLLAPLYEAVNYLLHVDARTRYEGLDLWYRVRRGFPSGEKSLAGALLLALGLALLAPAARAADSQQQAVKSCRREVAQITKQIKDADAFVPGRWLPRLQEVGRQLNAAAAEGRPGAYRWFERSLTGWAKADRAKALEILADLEQRLALAEETLAVPEEPGGPAKSKEEIKALLPPDTSDDRAKAKETAKERREKKERVRRDDFAEDGPPRRGGDGGIVTPNPIGGFGTVGWFLMGTLLVAVVVIAALLALRQAPTAPKTPAAKPAALSLEALLAQTEQPVGESLWRQADELARSGRWLDALRTLYVAVLALLHRADLIRYSQTRTNGEYLAELRPRTEVYLPFESLTGSFELKWYGEKACQPDDYQTCRQLAEQVRAEIKK
jgi:hypothetical protein